MHGINNFFNEPLMIDQAFLMSVLPQLGLGFKAQSFPPKEDINTKYFAKVEQQISSFSQKGISQFPVVLNIIGPILKYTDWYYTGTQTILKILKTLENDERVSGVLLNIDSGGGMGDGTRELADYIFNMKTPTIGYSNGLVCSAAMYLYSACKFRAASPHASWFGSIGTYIPFSDYSKIFEKMGAIMKDVYAPESSLKNFAWREMISHQNEQPLEQMAASFNNQFLSDIKRFYTEGIKDDGKIFKGEIYRPEEALNLGLIDELCSIEEAIQKF